MIDPGSEFARLVVGGVTLSVLFGLHMCALIFTYGSASESRGLQGAWLLGAPISLFCFFSMELPTFLSVFYASFLCIFLSRVCLEMFLGPREVGNHFGKVVPVFWLDGWLHGFLAVYLATLNWGAIIGGGLGIALLIFLVPLSRCQSPRRADSINSIEEEFFSRAIRSEEKR